jgi:hypothetical protein
MCTKRVAFITQIRQRKYLCSGKLCFLHKCTLQEKKMFFLECDEWQLYWASSKKRIRGNIRKIWNFFSEIFSISFLSFVWDAVYNWHIGKDLQLFYYIDHSWELLTLKIAYKHVSLWLRIDQVCDLLIYYIDIRKKMLEHRNSLMGVLCSL